MSLGDKLQAFEASYEQMKESRRKCWIPDCKKTAWLRDSSGWHTCFYHAYRSARWGGGNFWYYIRNLKFRWPYRGIE